MKLKNFKDLKNLIEQHLTTEEIAEVEKIARLALKEKKKAPASQLVWPARSNKRVLPPDDARTVFRLTEELDCFVGDKLGKDPKSGFIARKAIHDYWYQNPDIIDAFLLSKQGMVLPETEKSILLGWKSVIAGEFILLKQYKDHAIFYGPSKIKDEEAHYAVLGLTQDLGEMAAGYPLPLMIKTALLPYKDIIVFDGLVQPASIRFGRNMRESFIEGYREHKEKNRIITRLSDSSKKGAKKAK